MVGKIRALILNCAVFLVVFAGSGMPFAVAGDSIHFGSIFSEDRDYQVEESKENLNLLTERSAQQKTLEELHPELIPQNEKIREIQAEPPAPVYNNGKADPKIGVIRNSEMDRHVVYFIELRPIQGNSPKNLYGQPNTLNKPYMQLEPGEMVKVMDHSQEFINKQRMDRDNQGMWKQVGRYKDHDPTDLYVYYDWKNFETVIPQQTPVELDILVPRDMSSIPVYAKPGAWTWKDCQLGNDVCLDRIDQHTEAFLLDTSFATINDLRNRNASLQLFYKIGYRMYDKEGQVRHKIGWVPSFFARRKITMMPKQLLSNNEYGFSGFETDEERIQRLAKYYVFEDNMFSDNRLFSRWLKKRPGEKHEVFDNTFAFDGILSYNQFNLNQTFLPEPFSQHGIAVGMGFYVPLYVDLEAQGTANLTIPISHEPADLYKSTPLFRGDQWLMYTTPLGLNQMPLKFGFGIYYLTMFESKLNFGFKSFVGFQTKMALENENFWVDVRYGPTGQDFSFELSNREIGASLGVRMDSTRAYDSWTLYGDFSKTTYTSPNTGHVTEFDLLMLGIKKSF